MTGHDFTDYSRDPLAEAMGQAYVPPPPPPGASNGNGHHQANGQAPPTGGTPTEHLPADLWTASPVLGHIYQAALAQQAVPDVVLHAVLARLSAMVNHESGVVTGKGHAPLNHFVIAVGPSGANKSWSMKTAADLMGPWTATRGPQLAGEGFVEVTLGSGEGLADAYYGEVWEPKVGKDGKPILKQDKTPAERQVVRQVRHNALMSQDEGETMLALAERSGATVMQYLREMWTGAATGSSNVKAGGRRRRLPAGSYVMGAIIGWQPVLIDGLFADTSGGTPQRFCYANAERHPAITADVIDWPGPLLIPLSTWKVTATLEPHLRRQVREYFAGAGRDDEGPLDGHRLLLVCRVAALLALLHADDAGRTDYTVNDWHWSVAHTLVDTSRRLRDHLAGRASRRAVEQAQRREDSTVRATVRAAGETAYAERVRRAADLLVAAVEREGGEMTRGRAVHALRRFRDVADPAVLLALNDGRLLTEERDGSGSGGPRRVAVLRLVQHEED